MANGSVVGFIGLELATSLLHSGYSLQPLEIVSAPEEHGNTTWQYYSVEGGKQISTRKECLAKQNQMSEIYSTARNRTSSARLHICWDGEFK
ncbi:hypothetical protein KY285_005328 [Solanum tuberosum]|nr:hypothetical protein KY285_005328 [Solanum tuberosum]